ncbi:MAG: 4-phosphoerythronate dehydrogenase [Alteromonadaceae bacterium]|nr:4-phosphoerythronate dehydrogenase [Alteromonadaceae bacterium]
MKIYYDENMPFADKFFGELGDLFPFSGRKLTAEQVADADVLLVRSITQVNEALLCKNTKLAFVGTATIGMDHIDQNYLASRNIPFYSAPGCNAISVAEYVLSALVVMAERYLLNLSSLTIGIIGAGNTGTQLSKKCEALGIKYLLYDPLLEQTDDKRKFVTLEQALNCDVISLHVPLTRQGEYATYHLLDELCLKGLRDDQILINACRGEVIDNQALLKIKQQGHGIKLILDVWENEPNVLLPLIEFADIATAHIAGYSLEGKASGTEMLYQALCKELNKPIVLNLGQFLPTASINYVEIKQDFDEIILNQLVKMVYDVRRDDAIFRQQISCQGFDMIRKTYPARREFSAISVSLQNVTKCDVPHRLGFNR